MKVKSVKFDFTTGGVIPPSYDQPAKSTIYNIVSHSASLDVNLDWLVNGSDLSKSKVRNLSKRRKKITLKRYTENGFYDGRSGKLVDPNKRSHKYIKQLPLEVTMTCVDLSSVMTIPI